MEQQLSPKVEIDESLYSRQLYVMGKEAQMKMASSSVLIAGINGLGVEVAKNVILAGVKSVSLFDQKTATWEDLSSQFYLSERDLGQNRANVSVSKLAELNPYVNVTVANGSSLLQAIQQNNYHVVVVIDFPLSVQQEVAEYCHNHQIAVIIGDVRGVCGQIFCDFGESFVVTDADGEPAASSLIAGITHDAKALVTCLEETRHNLNTGDVVVLSDVVGMTELNGKQFSVTVKDPFSFEINHNTSNYQAYERGGYVNQVKQPTTISFKRFSQTLTQPGEFQGDFSKFLQFPILHFCFRTLQEYLTKHQGQFPLPRNKQSAEEFFHLFKEINAQAKGEESADLKLTDTDVTENETFIKTFAMTCRGNLSPVCALLGGVLGQEVLKAVSGKFMPIRQWFYFSAMDALPEEEEGEGLKEEDFQPVGSRYDGQIVVFGRELQAKLAKLRLFLVGAGAIGCEMLKNWAMMGISCDASKQGQVIVTDMDSIEKSNLSRQFLFRSTDINKQKSTTAIKAVTAMNPSFHGQALEQKVAQETENIFNDDFYESLDAIITALDNVEARLYLDQKCLFYSKPMLESGTLGAKGHTQVVVPGKTENYGATRDPPEKSIPVCTLKHFPNQIEHTLQWSREWFEEVFKQLPDDISQYINNPNFLPHLDNQPNIKLETLTRLKDSLITSKPQNIADCVVWARKGFEDLYANRIKQLLHNFPLDRLTSSGTPFWSGSKKPPLPIEFDVSDPLHAEFIISVANMRASLYHIPTCSDHAYMLSVAGNVAVEQFKPAEGVKIASTDEELKAEEKQKEQQQSSRLESATDLDRVCASLLQSLPTPESLKAQGFTVQSIEFDKDLDSHMHIIASSSNLRARNYKIPEADLHTSRGIAGKITPAIATTTALVTGAICLEIYKLLLNKKANQYLNTFTNLAVPLFTSMEPEPPKVTKSKIKGEEWKWTQWDRLDINNPTLTVEGLIAYMNSEYQLEVSMLSSGVTILYSDFMDRKKQAERKTMGLKKLVETVTKKEIPANQKYLVFEIMASDSDSGDDVELPYVRFRLL